ncbi:hypothetical protein M5K25_020966 [Dendrobium thyrsiflorum]|uniref:Uncharacterized protein n=1 Tax=Dendrobium thyrsiflorum TaxID=117978 RepID=A0ABD0UB78_DENTH
MITIKLPASRVLASAASAGIASRSYRDRGWQSLRSRVRSSDEGEISVRPACYRRHSKTSQAPELSGFSLFGQPSSTRSSPLRSQTPNRSLLFVRLPQFANHSTSLLRLLLPFSTPKQSRHSPLGLPHPKPSPTEAFPGRSCSRTTTRRRSLLRLSLSRELNPTPPSFFDSDMFYKDQNLRSRLPNQCSKIKRSLKPCHLYDCPKGESRYPPWLIVYIIISALPLDC